MTVDVDGQMIRFVYLFIKNYFCRYIGTVLWLMMAAKFTFSHLKTKNKLRTAVTRYKNDLRYD